MALIPQHPFSDLLDWVEDDYHDTGFCTVSAKWKADKLTRIMNATWLCAHLRWPFQRRVVLRLIASDVQDLELKEIRKAFSSPSIASEGISEDSSRSSDLERYLDLLDEVDEEEFDEDPHMTLTDQTRLVETEWSHGPLRWSVRCSISLQRAVDALNFSELNDLKFSVTLADPKQPDFPLVACSSGFADLTGYSLQEIVGRNCRFLLNGVPTQCINKQARTHAHNFCLAVTAGLEYDARSEVLPDGVDRCGVDLPKGEIICVQTNAKKTGELFYNMFCMKHVWLDGDSFIIGLQAGIPEEFADGAGDNLLEELQRKCSRAWSRLGQHITILELVLCSHFWYTSHMRRQVSSGPADFE
jgi:hypothetical protein